MRVVMFGGSGFLGRAVAPLLMNDGHEVIVVGRGEADETSQPRRVQWDARTLGPWTACLEGADAVLHLAGKRVDCRPTEANIDELIRSREATVQLVGEAIRGLERPPSTWVQLSSLAIFGDAGDEIIDESTEPATTGPRQMVEVCRRWEAAFEAATTDVARTVLLRPAICIGGEGDPATAQLMQLAKLGLAGPVAGGRQWVSWIGATDFFALVHRAITDPTMSGLYHLTAPEPVRNERLMAAYRSAVGRRFGLPTPTLITKIGAALLGGDAGLVLTGRRVVPTRLLNEGWTFAETDFDAAVRSAVALA